MQKNLFVCEGCPKNWKKLKKFWNFFFIKSFLIIIYELCQHLGSLRSLWKAPETKTLGGGGTKCPPPVQSKVKMNFQVTFSRLTKNNIQLQCGLNGHFLLPHFLQEGQSGFWYICTRCLLHCFWFYSFAWTKESFYSLFTWKWIKYEQIHCRK